MAAGSPCQGPHTAFPWDRTKLACAFTLPRVLWVPMSSAVLCLCCPQPWPRKPYPFGAPEEGTSVGG